MMQNNKIIWMMGGSGSGKSFAAKVMQREGVYVIDADDVAHSILYKGEKAYSEVLSAFGTSFLLENGEIDRKALGRLVFGDSEKLDTLNKITHKYIKEKIISLLNTDGITVIDAPLPPDKFLKCDILLYITAPKERRIERICKRDSLDIQTAENRLASQKEIDGYIENADVIIINDGTEKEFETKIKDWCINEKII